MYRILLNSSDSTMSLIHNNPIIVRLTQQNPTYSITSSSGGKDKHYTQEFTNEDTVIVEHNLHKRPAITVIDSAGDEVVGKITHDTVDQATVVFTSSFSGRVTCN